MQNLVIPFAVLTVSKALGSMRKFNRSLFALHFLDVEFIYHYSQMSSAEVEYKDIDWGHHPNRGARIGYERQAKINEKVSENAIDVVTYTPDSDLIAQVSLKEPKTLQLRAWLALALATVARGRKVSVSVARIHTKILTTNLIAGTLANEKGARSASRCVREDQILRDFCGSSQAASNSVMFLY